LDGGAVELLLTLREASMPEPFAAYRLYFYTPAGQHPGPPEIASFRSDDEAIAWARIRQAGHLVELWQGDRLVARLRPETGT
jgi:hypothetical protein